MMMVSAELKKGDAVGWCRNVNMWVLWLEAAAASLEMTLLYTKRRPPLQWVEMDA